jgi:phosphopantothenoylcysteine synthetase/decarboxylase
LKILVSYGPVAVPVDSMRLITNRSTGSTGEFLCKGLRKLGFEIVVLRAKTCPPLQVEGIEEIPFETFEPFRTLLREQLGKHEFWGVIHLAAVADYSVDRIEFGDKRIEGSKLLNSKLDSSDAPVIYLKSNEKLLGRIREWSRNPHSIIVGFKYTVEEDSSKIPAMLSGGRVDFVVHNWCTGIEGSRHEFKIYSRDEKQVESGASKGDLVNQLGSLMGREKL